MTDCNFVEKAIQLVKQATEADQKGDYKEAFRLYSLSVEYFLTALKCILSLFPTFVFFFVVGVLNSSFHSHNKGFLFFFFLLFLM
jgi:hypothetical protein